jgi:hypothetical protein
MAMLALLLVLPAQAPAKEPTGAFAVFKQCPRFTPKVRFCLYTKTTGGGIAIGNFRLPLENPITLQGGYSRDEETGAETFFGVLDGETMSRAPQPVPGGLLGIVTLQPLPQSLKTILQGLIHKGITGVTATTELAKPASSIGLSTDNLINEEGVGLSLPVKIHLQNPFLGNECYIGSNDNPLVLSLTDGTTTPPAPNRPVSGMLGHLKFERELRPVGELEFIEVTNNVSVNNSFSVPTASSCGGAYSSVIDPVLDSKLGLPSVAGHNTIVEIDTIKLTLAEKAIAAEE